MFIQPLQYKPLSSIASSGALAPAGGLMEVGASPTPSFKDTLNEALGTVTESMDKADRAEEALMSGRAESIHEVQIAGAKADVLMKLTCNLASKVAHCTTQLFQMQV